MSSYAIRAESLCKEYCLGRGRPTYRTFREAVVDSLAAPIRRLRSIGKEATPEERFWALKGVTFEVKPGEVVGIIGRNGAGKSTLLKILSRITAPTKGRVEIRGRVASLLEVGTGFHPELTGRENIFLNGAILGMSRTEICKKFDEIVAFAEVEKFLDTPVKHYSSGMYVRLAFAVAAHLESEILVVDEILAVGDARFQEKCLGKIKVIAGHGRTVLFVSHNMGAVRALCGSGIYLKDGLVEATGTVGSVLARYTQSVAGNAAFTAMNNSSSELAIEHAEILIAERAHVGIALCLKARVRATKARKASFDIRLKDATGAPMGFASIGALDLEQMIVFLPGYTELSVEIPVGQIAEGIYTLSLDLAIPNVSYIQRLDDCLSIQVSRNTNKFGARPPSQAWGLGSMYFQAKVIDQVQRHKTVIHA